MTTAAPSPLTVFRSSRDIFLNSVVSGVSGLESAVLEFERDHARRTAAAESESARLRGENAELLAELGEKEEALQEARAGVPVLAMPAVPEDPAELIEARETIRELQAQLDERPVPAADENADTEEDRAAAEAAAAQAERLRLELVGAGETIATQARALQEEARLRDQLADEARNRREEYDRNLADLRDEITGLEEAAREADRTMEARMEAARIAARAEALNIVKAVAADSPDTPLDEALDLVVIAMDVPAPADVEEFETPEPDGDAEAPETAEAPEADDAFDRGLEVPELDTDDEPEPMLSFESDDAFFATLAPPVVQEDASIFGAPDEDPETGKDVDAATEPQLMFDIDAPLEKEPAKEPEAPKPGFGMFRKGSQAA